MTFKVLFSYLTLRIMLTLCGQAGRPGKKRQNLHSLTKTTISTNFEWQIFVIIEDKLCYIIIELYLEKKYKIQSLYIEIQKQSVVRP